MNHVERAFLKVLQGNVQYEDNNVPVIISTVPSDKTPCITISNEEGVFIKRIVEKANYKLPDSHPLFDPENPDKEYPQQVVHDRKQGYVIVDIWVDDKKQRREISEQVELLLFESTFYNYKFCINFDKDTKKCSTTNQECDTLTVLNHRGIKGFCPYPKERKYANLLYAHGIVHGSVKIRHPIMIDELDKTPPLLRNHIKIDLEFYNTFVVGGNPVLRVSSDIKTKIK